MRNQFFTLLFFLVCFPSFFFTASAKEQLLSQSPAIFQNHKPSKLDLCKKFFKRILPFNREDIVSGPPPKYQVYPMKRRSDLDKGAPPDDDSIKATNQFQQALRKGKFKGDDRYISVPLNEGLFAKVIQLHETGVTVDIITYTGQIKKTMLFGMDARLAKVSQASKNWFERMEAAPDSVGPFNIPSFHEEEHLKAQGFRKIFYSGLNKVKRLKYLAQLLREGNINPFTTHIVDLIPFIDNTLAFIENGIRKQGQNVEKRQEILRSLAREAQEKVDKGEVSLYWFLHWNFRLVWLASLTAYIPSMDESNYWWLTEASWNQHLNNNMRTMNFSSIINRETRPVIRTMRTAIQYPEQIFLPLRENLGIIALNEASVDADFAIQITNKKKITDNIPMNPFEHWDHELDHIRIINSEQKNKKVFRQFYSQWRTVRDSFPREKREMVEWVFFFLFREIEGGISLTDSVAITQALSRRTWRFKNPNDLKPFLPPDLLPNALDNMPSKSIDSIIEDYFKKSAEVFSQTALSFQFNP